MVRSLDKPLLLQFDLIIASIVFSYLPTLGFASNKIFNDSTILFKSIFYVIGFYLLIFFSLLNDLFQKNCYIFFISLILLV